MNFSTLGIKIVYNNKNNRRRISSMINKNYDQCFLCEYATQVKEVIEDKGFYWHYLKKTIFFVESGGMKSDIGTINNYPVLGLKVENNKVWHLLDVKLEGGVFLSVNLHDRFRKAQIHTTQHLISALIKGVYGCLKVSHYVGEDENSIEFDIPEFSVKQCTELQILANGLIRDDLKITISYPSRAEALKHVSKETCNHHDLRVVQIGNLDYNLCGCIHVPSLRYLQMIKILGFIKTTRGIKIRYTCGDQLLENFEKRYEVLEEASHALALSPLYINSGINKLFNDKKQLQQKLIDMKNNYYECLAKEIHESEAKSVVIHELSNVEMQDLYQFALGYTHNYKSVVCFMVHNDEVMRLVIARHEEIDIDSEAIFKEVAGIYQLKGGGNKQIAQGEGPYQSEIMGFLKNNPIIK